MAFARLAPHCGLTPVYGHYVGNCEMRGGFSWSSIGNSLSSGLKNIGSFINTTARRIGNSEAFQQAKQGFLNSGIIENAGSLAGQTISSLVDIGRLKMEQDLARLRDQALGTAQSGTVPPLTQEQLAQLLATSSTSQTPITPSVTPDTTVVTSVPSTRPPVIPVDPVQTVVSTEPRVLPPPFVPIARPDYLPPASTDAVPLGPLQPETEVVTVTDPFRPPSRKRKRVDGWGAALDRMTGGRVQYDSHRFCY